MRPSNALFSVFTVLSRHRRILGAIGLVFLLESLYNVYTLRSPHPATGVPLDKPFHVGCQEPNTSAPRENATILILARNADVDGAVKSLTSLEERFNKWYHYPVVFLNDQAWDQGFKEAVTKVASGLVQFGVIEKSMWEYPEWIDQTSARMNMEAQAKAGVIYAGNESYHHMCRFYSGSVKSLKEIITELNDTGCFTIMKYCGHINGIGVSSLMYASHVILHSTFATIA